MPSDAIQHYIILKVSLRRTGLRQRLDRRMLLQMHAALFPNIRLLAVSERSMRSATLTVAVTHPSKLENVMPRGRKDFLFDLFQPIKRDSE